MQSEIEAKFMDLNHDVIRERLAALGATLEHPMRLMRRKMFDFPDGRLQKDNWSRVRVRDEGDKITVTYKSGNDKEYSKEVETTVGSFDNMCKLFEAIGLKVFTFQESKRETWQLDDVEIVLDVWPWLDQYIEIEGPTEEAIKNCAQKLQLNWDDAAYGNIDTAYRHQYPGMKAEETIGVLPELKFDDVFPSWLEQRKSPKAHD